MELNVNRRRAMGESPMGWQSPRRTRAWLVPPDAVEAVRQAGETGIGESAGDFVETAPVERLAALRRGRWRMSGIRDRRLSQPRDMGRERDFYRSMVVSGGADPELHPH